ncbi:hypothetical protein ILYODFUR_009083 [Ilyodon furcidens]|uniref:Uncharacterized protein n=2 Tax=Goodeidae TaxID=28758 RepID=A0ABV0U3T2_9TELE
MGIKHFESTSLFISSRGPLRLHFIMCASISRVSQKPQEDKLHQDQLVKTGKLTGEVEEAEPVCRGSDQPLFLAPCG